MTNETKDNGVGVEFPREVFSISAACGWEGRYALHCVEVYTGADADTVAAATDGKIMAFAHWPGGDAEDRLVPRAVWDTAGEMFDARLVSGKFCGCLVGGRDGPEGEWSENLDPSATATIGFERMIVQNEPGSKTRFPVPEKILEMIGAVKAEIYIIPETLQRALDVIAKIVGANAAVRLSIHDPGPDVAEAPFVLTGGNTDGAHGVRAAVFVMPAGNTAEAMVPVVNINNFRHKEATA